MPIPSKTESIQTLSVKDRIYNVVCEWIITGVLKSGEKILDSELAQYFDVSRTPVREAIQMLERQKLVKVIPAFAAEEACERISEEQLQALKDCYDQFATACADGAVEQLLSGDTKFHEIIVKAADNEYVEDFSRILQLHISRIRYHYFHENVNPIRSVGHHEKILQALVERNKAKAKEIMREHWLLSMEYSLDIARKMQI